MAKKKTGSSWMRSILSICGVVALQFLALPAFAQPADEEDEQPAATTQPAEGAQPVEGTQPAEGVPPAGESKPTTEGTPSPAETQPPPAPAETTPAPAETIPPEPPVAEPAATEAAAAEAAAAEAAALKEAEGEVEEIVITGTLIKRKDLTTPAPVTVIGRQQLDAAGKASIGEILQNLPSQSNAINIQVNNGGDGSTRINMRGIGERRTLVLVNGRRHVAGGTGADASVDLNSIPEGVIERIEVLKDGASAIYGSDAVGGVVNIITRRDFDGVDASIYGGTTKSGGQVYDLNVTAGMSGKEKKGNILFSAGYFEQFPIWTSERPFSKFDKYFDFDCYNHEACMDPWVTSNGSSSVPQGYIRDWEGASAGGNQAWQDLKAKYPGKKIFFHDLEGGGWRPFSSAGNWDDILPDGERAGDLYNYQPDNFLVTPQQRFNLFSTGSYRFFPALRGFYEAGFTNRRSEQKLASEPLFTISEEITVSADNYYNPFGRDFSDVRRRMVEGGYRTFSQDINTFRFVGGLEAFMPEGLGPLSTFIWNLSWNYGITRGTDTKRGSFIRTRLAEALGPSFKDELTGELRCGTPDAPIADCVPLDVFGGYDPVTKKGTISKAMLDYIGYVGTTAGFNELSSILLTTDGELFKIPFGDTVGLALGYEYSEYAGAYIPDPMTATGNTTGNKGTATQGGYLVNAGFGELSIPLLKKIPAAERLELNLAARAFDYSSFGSDFTWKVGGRWEIIPDIAVRGTVSTAFRAPSIGELFGGTADDFPNVTDPCNNSPDDPRSANEQRVCTDQQKIPAEYTDERKQLKSRVGGNPDLKPETATIFTFGGVLQPRFLKGLSLTVDYFNMKIKKSIQPIGASVILSQCYDVGADVDPAKQKLFCDKIHRDPVTKYLIYIEDTQQNIGGAETSGIDFALNYDYRAGSLGRFLFNFEATWTHKYDEEQADGKILHGLNRYDLGVFPDFKFNTGVIWALEGWGAGANVRFINSFTECKDNDCRGLDDDATKGSVRQRTVKPWASLDLFASYTFRFDSKETQLSLGCNNVLDKDPSKIYNGFLATSDPATYDFFGRYFYFKLTQRI